MALDDILMMESDIVEPMTEIPVGTLNAPEDQLGDQFPLNELTLVLEASYSS
jgi:hypothetical protein